MRPSVSRFQIRRRDASYISRNPEAGFSTRVATRTRTRAKLARVRVSTRTRYLPDHLKEARTLPVPVPELVSLGAVRTRYPPDLTDTSGRH